MNVKPALSPIACLLSVALLASHGTAHATGGISCASADQATRVEVLVSLTGEAAGSGVIGVMLSQGATRSSWKVTRANADYARKTMRVAATREADDVPGSSAAAHLTLTLYRERGRLVQGDRRWVLRCDWGEFS